MSAQIPENAIIVDLTTTYGSMIVGCFLSCVMWGISSLQTFLYFALYESDPMSRKILVTFLWVVDTVNQIIVLMSMWPVLIKHYGSIQGLAQIQPGLTHHAWVAQLVEFCVQVYFIHRIYVFSGKRWLFPLCMMVLSLYQLICLIPYDIITLAHGAAAANLSSHRAISIVISLRAVTAAEDAMLAGALIYLVVKNGLPQFQRSRRMAVRLLVVTVNTGLWTAVVALVELCLVAKFPNGLQFTIVEFPLCSLYFSSLLASLNARDYVKGSTSADTTNETPSHLKGTRATSGNTLYLGPLKNGMSTTGKTVSTDLDTVESKPIVYGLDSGVHHMPSLRDDV